MRNLIRTSLLAFIGSIAFFTNAQEILTQEHPLKEVKSVYVLPHQSQLQGMKLSQNEDTRWSVEVDPAKIKLDENSRVVTTIKEEVEGTTNYFIALVDDVPQTKLMDYTSRPLYYPMNNFKVEARLLVDSTSMNLPFYREMYMKGFMNYLAVAERFGETELNNYWPNQFYLLPEDSMYFMANQVDISDTKQILHQVFPNAVLIASSGKVGREVHEQTGSVKMKKKTEEAKFSSKEEVIASKGLPLYFMRAENALVVQIVPFVEDGEIKIQKYFLHKTQGVVHSSQRTIKANEEPLYNRLDLRDFKNKPTQDQIRSIKSGKGIK